MFGPVGFWEIVMIVLIALVLFGPKKLPEVAKTVGKTWRDFKRAIDDAKATIEHEIDKVDLRSDIKTIDNTIKDTLTHEVNKTISETDDEKKSQ
jgi:Tat protein translocase TatB subunit